jgi:hypothetical protein
MMKSKYPASCLYLGCIGEDDVGKVLEDAAHGEGL